MAATTSLSRRLLTGAAVFIAAALIVSTMAIYFVLHRFVQGQIDQRLDSQIVFLTSMLRADSSGVLSLAGDADGPPFDRPRRGWYWQVSGPNNALRSRSLGDVELDVPELTVRPRREPPPRRGEDVRRPPGERPMPADGSGPDDQYLHFRVQQVAVLGTPATVVVSAPRQAVAGPLREAMLTLGVSLAILAAALIAAMLLQVRLGLRPLDRLRRSVAEVRTANRERVPEDQPAEIKPLVTELNALLEQNSENLERARRHVANLAHGLKTPLATLALAVPKERGDTRELIELMERRIRHHLGRARMAALSGPVRARTTIAPRLADLGALLEKVHADRAVALSFDVPDDLSVACEPQDFDEMAGNLMENAFKSARGKVHVRAVRKDGHAVLFVEDDGAGLSAEQMPEALRPGARLDETAPGFGFGLSITRELAELYGGSLTLGRSDFGGLVATLALPSAPN